MTPRRMAVIAGAAALVVLAARAEAEPVPVDVAWWTTSQVAGVPIGQASMVQDGGSQVANGSSGPTSIAAIGFPAPSGATSTYRALVEFASTPDTATVVACPTTSDWAPGPPGTFEDAPSWDCEIAQASGVYDPGTDTVSWELGPDFVRAGRVDVMLLPTADAAPFTLTMAPPAEDAVESDAPAEPAPTTSTAVTPTTATPPMTTPAPSTTAATTFTVPAPSPTGTLDPLPSVPTTSPRAPSGLPAPLPTIAQTATPATGGDGDSTFGRAAAFTALLGAAAAAIVLWRGGRATLEGPDRTRGIGRFRHERLDPPLDI